MNDLTLINPMSLPNEDSASDGNDDAQLMQACQQFESVLMGQMFSGMQPNSLHSDIFGGGSEDEMYGQMLNQEMLNQVSGSQGLGLSKLLFEQFTGRSPEEAELSP